MRFSTMLFILIIFFSCDQRVNQLEYDYTVYGENNQIRGFCKRNVSIDKNLRVDTVYMFNKNREENKLFIDKFEVLENGIKNKNSEDYLLAVKDTCYEYNASNSGLYEICYLGKYDLDIDSKEYKDVHKFLIKALYVDGLSKYKYLDENFILLREEFKDGYIDYYRIDRTD